MAAAALACLTSASLSEVQAEGPPPDAQAGTSTPEREPAPEVRVDAVHQCGTVGIPFPFQPYSVQREFMEALCKCLDAGGLGVFESPTGTGKTLSLINATLQWFTEFRQKQAPEPQQIAPADDSLPDWLRSAHLKRKRDEIEAGDAQRVRRRRRAHRRLSGRRVPVAGDESDGALSDPSNDGESRGTGGLSADLMKGLYSDSDSGSDTSEQSSSCGAGSARVIYTSRTHTQLKQFLGELKRTRWWAHPQIHLASVASRQQLCINAAVQARSQGSSDRLNDLCTQLGKLKKKNPDDTKCTGCEFTDRSNLRKLGDRIRVRPMDIEELVSAGKRDCACPYYASRKAAKEASLLLLPYSSLLSEGTRQSLGVDVAGSVVVVDEAHNAVDAVNAASSTELPVTALGAFADACQAYLAKYGKRVHLRNKAVLRTLLRTLRRLEEWAGAKVEAVAAGQCAAVIPRTALLVDAGLETVNTPLLDRFMRRRQLIPRLVTTLERMAQGGKPIATAAQLYAVGSFLTALIGDEEDSRVILTKGSDGRCAVLRVASMYAATAFEPLLRSAHAVVLAGGTMSPVDDVLQQLLPASGTRPKVTQFSCGHVVPPENVLACNLAAGPAGVRFDFSYRNRGSPELISDLGRCVLNLVRCTPGGVVLFFPSYGYEETVLSAWRMSGLLAELKAVKPVIRDAQGSGTADTLDSFQTAVRQTGGAVLTSVVGGRLSEGINFADDLARLVCVVGMPYPNPKDPELEERMRVLTRRVGRSAADALLDTMCMKAVNQSIGRAIRHKADYAALLLLDYRYARPQSQSRVAGWIRGRLQIHQKFAPCFRQARDFFLRVHGRAAGAVPPQAPTVPCP